MIGSLLPVKKVETVCLRKHVAPGCKLVITEPI